MSIIRTMLYMVNVTYLFYGMMHEISCLRSRFAFIYVNITDLHLFYVNINELHLFHLLHEYYDYSAELY